MEFVHSRAEDGGKTEIRGKFDTVVSRAVANLTVLSSGVFRFETRRLLPCFERPVGEQEVGR